MLFFLIFNLANPISEINIHNFFFYIFDFTNSISQVKISLSVSILIFSPQLLSSKIQRHLLELRNIKCLKVGKLFWIDGSCQSKYFCFPEQFILKGK